MVRHNQRISSVKHSSDCSMKIVDDTWTNSFRKRHVFLSASSATNTPHQQGVSYLSLRKLHQSSRSVQHMLRDRWFRGETARGKQVHTFPAGFRETHKHKNRDTKHKHHMPVPLRVGADVNMLSRWLPASSSHTIIRSSCSDGQRGSGGILTTYLQNDSQRIR